MADAAGPWSDFNQPAAGQPAPAPSVATPAQPQGPWSEFAGTKTSVGSTDEVSSGGFQDFFFGDSEANSAAHILNQFGQGFKDGWGTGPGLADESADFLKKAGIYNDAAKGQNDIVKSFNEAVMRPAAAGLDTLVRGGQALVKGLQAGTEQAFTQAGQPQLGRDIAALPEAFPLAGAEIGGLPGTPPALRPMTPADLNAARDLHVIGPGGEGAYFGTSDPPPPDPALDAKTLKDAVDAEKEAAPVTGQGETPATAAPSAPDVHQIARQLNPEVFAKYDPLVERDATLRDWINEMGEDRQNAPEAQQMQSQISDILGKVSGVEDRLTNRQASQLSDLRDQLQDFLTTDTPGMASVRRAQQENQYLMRDLSPQVTAAYDTAQKLAPDAEPVDAVQTAEATPAPTEQPIVPEATAAPEPSAAPLSEGQAQAATNIAQDVAGRLVAAGRPDEEATNAGALVQAHYEARAANLGTDAHTLYQNEAPGIELAEKGRKGEMGRTVIREGRNTIRLMKNADASTFIHETGHQWLDELMQDAGDDRAIPQVTADAQTVRDYLGHDPTELQNGKPTRAARAAHEKFARGFERYMMEGHAPSAQLAGVFEKFKGWLTQIYQTVAKLRSPISDDIRRVFDRMLTSEGGKVIAPEREIPPNFADVHENFAENTPAAEAAPVADRVASDIQSIASEKAPEVADELGRGETGPSAPQGEGIAGGADATGERPAGEDGNPPQSGAVGSGGSEVAREGGGTRTLEKPVTAEDPIPPSESRLMDKAGNIRVENLNTPEDVSQVIRDTAEQNDNFLNARAKVSDQQVIDLAEAMGTETSQINLAHLADVLGQGQLASKIMAARNLLVQSATSVRDLMTKAAKGSDADVLAMAEGMARHRMIQQHLSAVTAEAGRALRAFHDLGGNTDEMQMVGDIARQATGLELFQLRNIAKKGANLDTPGEVSKFVADSTRSGLFDWIQSTFINALISGPLTHAGYTVAGQALALFRAVGETGAAAFVGQLRKLVGAGPEERAEFGEVPAQLYGMFRGARNGVKAAWASIKSNQVELPPEVQGAQVAVAQSIGTMGGHMGDIPNPMVAGIKVPVGTVLQSPSRLVAALHSFNWTTFYSQSISAQAFRMAMEEKLEGNAFSDRVAQLTQSPTPEMIAQGSLEANGGALMNRPAYDSAMGLVSRLTNVGMKVPDIPLPGGGSFPMGTFRPLKYIDPFVQIQSNIQRVAFMRGTPLALFRQAVRDDLMGKNGGVAFDQTVGKMIAGTGFMIGAGALASQGLLNGSGPSDPQQAREWQRIYGQPHGLTIGDLSYDMLRLGPLGLQMSVAADLYHAGSEIGKSDAIQVASDLTHAFAANIVDESSMRGPADMMKAVDEYDRYGAAWTRNFISSAIPFSVGLSQVARVVDPYSRNARTTMDAILAKIPFASETLLPRRDVWGEPVSNRGWAGTYSQQIQNDPVDKALYALAIYPSLPLRTIKGVKLTDQQYDDYSRIAGRLAKMRLNAYVGMPGYTSIPPVYQHAAILDIMKSSREIARAGVQMQSSGTANDITRLASENKVAPIKRPQ